MLSKYLATVMLGTALIAAPAMSQTQSPSSSTSPAAPAAKSTDAKTSDSAAMNPALKNKWRSSKLIGLDVYNDQNEKLGDINELILDKDGKVAFAIIGVGGFLGMGAHDIAVTLDKLKFVEEPVRTASTTTTTTGTAAPPASTTGATPGSTSMAKTAAAPAAYDWVPDHAVMSGTKEQLQALPQFKYSDYN